MESERKGNSPVVALVLNETARGARRALGQIIGDWLHGQVEAISTDDLVKVRSIAHSWVNQGIDAIDNQLGAGETQHVELGNGAVDQQRRSGGEGSPLVHLEGCCLCFLSLGRLILVLRSPCGENRACGSLKRRWGW
jgi:hypothetical protein